MNIKQQCMKKILLLTPIYPGNEVHKSTTPVVHYFTREWVKMGYDVRVIHYPVNFPKIVYAIAKHFKERIATIMGSEIRTWPLVEIEYEWENINVKRIPLVKIKPHARYPFSQIKRAVQKTIKYCNDKNFQPNVIIGHWANPTLEIMHYLKEYYKIPTCFVAHDIGWDFDTIFRREAQIYLNETNVIGYRSNYIRKSFEENYGCKNKRYFMCYSGLPELYIESVNRKIINIHNFLFVGTLLKRKYPAEIIPAVYNAFGKEDFTISYIGYGEETKKIKLYAAQYNVIDKVKLLGFIERTKIVEYLDKSDVFVMISKNETFGLVYLEAMARGCITIAAKKEGFDGIIIDGKNGFLCEAGNVEELTSIIKKIKKMDCNALNEISQNAINTAKALTDVNVASNYLNSVFDAINK